MRYLLNHASFRNSMIFKMSLTSFLVNNVLNSKVAALGKSQKGLFNCIFYRYWFYNSGADLFVMFAGKRLVPTQTMGRSDLLKSLDYLPGDGH